MVWRPKKHPSRIACTFQDNKGQIVFDQIRTVDKARLIRKLDQIKRLIQDEVLDVLAEMYANDWSLGRWLKTGPGEWKNSCAIVLLISG